MLLAWIRVPGIPTPVLIGDTHLNSRHASGVGADRANRAYTWQVGDLEKLVAKSATPDTPVIIGGDFNIGRDTARVTAFGRSALLGSERRDDLTLVREASLENPGSDEFPAIMANNKIKLFSREGRGVRVEPLEAWVPFPSASDPSPLSDHAGLVVEYRLITAPTGR